MALAEGRCVAGVELWTELSQPLAHISCGPGGHREGEAKGGELRLLARQSGLRRHGDKSQLGEGGKKAEGERGERDGTGQGLGGKNDLVSG